MATIPPPPKFKAYLGQLKENVLDVESPNVNVVYQALLAAELVQRGVLVDIIDTDKLLDAVVSTAGRPLLDTTALPKPLLAASSVMAGMIAESCATLVASGQSTSDLSIDIFQTALTRCNDVKDERLSSLLQLLVTDDIKEGLLLHVAEGHFLRAASIQPDPPQMWKRSLDVIERRLISNATDTEPFEARFPLTHLITIASSKGNEKRVSELSLRLSESWLSTKEQLSSNLETNVVEAFVIPYRPSETHTEAECVNQARQIISKVNTELVQDDLLWDKLLRFRIEWAAEEAEINNLAEETTAAAKNRGASVTVESCKQSARSEVLVKSLENDALNKCANDLRDLMLTSNMKDVSPREASAMDLLSQQSERLVDRAQAVSLAIQTKKTTCTAQDSLVAWDDVICFTKPIVQRIGELSSWNTLESLNDREQSVNRLVSSLPSVSHLFLQSALLASSCWAWMTCNRDSGSSVELSFLELMLDTLAVCLSLGQRNEHASKDDSILKSSREEGENQVELQCAHAAVLSRVGLAHFGEEYKGLALLTHEASRKATGMMEKAEKYELYQGKYGSAYLLLLLAWSGLHQSPWPFCNVTQARAIIRGARASMQTSSVVWGRVSSTFESLLLDLSEADAEGGSLIGGFADNAEGLYKKCLCQGENITEGAPPCVASLVEAHCLNGLARLLLDRGYKEDTMGPNYAREQAGKALDQAIGVPGECSVPFYLWMAKEASAASALFHVNASRHLIADSLVRMSHPGDAQAFLEDAVRDDPSDYDAAFAFGAFRLRMALYETGDSSPEEQKMAQTQLLKSAKINSAKADPFALLGIWYEVQKDLKRALGCFSKALLLDPTNPVAGRGVLRLKSPSETQKLCVAATNFKSPVIGWAWQALGHQKAMVENDDELAIICFLQALRCRDIGHPLSEPLSIFFAPPAAVKRTRELSNVWADLAECYRRVGRYAAADRAFQSAWNVDEDRLDSRVFCSWAQVEIALGLFEEAIEKFELVLERKKDSSHTMAAYGQGLALLALANQVALDGKAGAAFQHAKRALKWIENMFLADKTVSSRRSGCALKLLGDLYSFGALLPPDVFIDSINCEASNYERSQCLLKAQASFVSKGEEAYKNAAELQTSFDKDATDALRASLLCDLGANILLQGQILSVAGGEAQGGTPELSLKDVIANDNEVKKVYDRSAQVFKDTITANPLHGPAWCGLGCSLSPTNPLLAQHSFCTALMLDKMMPDSWSNLAFLFASEEANAPSAEMLDGLTQVADSPLMWICRAFLLENEVKRLTGPEELQFSRAADAYRAALQVVRHPAALLGLSLACRATVSNNQTGYEEEGTYYKLSSDHSRRNSYGYMGEYMGLSSSCNAGSCVLGGVMELEDIVAKIETSRQDQTWWYDVAQQARDKIIDGTKSLSQFSSGASSSGDGIRGIDVDVIKSVAGHDLPMSVAADSITEESKAVEHLPTEYDTPARRVMNDPESGIAWLELTKSLAKEILNISTSKNKKLVKEVIESATRAAFRSAQIFSNQVSSPLTLRSAPFVAVPDSEAEAVVSTSVAYFPVDARDASEALSLSYWLETLKMEMLNETEVESSPTSAVDLQRALFMDPGNEFARQALHNLVCK